MVQDRLQGCSLMPPSWRLPTMTPPASSTKVLSSILLRLPLLGRLPTRYYRVDAGIDQVICVISALHHSLPYRSRSHGDEGGRSQYRLCRVGDDDGTRQHCLLCRVLPLQLHDWPRHEILFVYDFVDLEISIFLWWM